MLSHFVTTLYCCSICARVSNNYCSHSFKCSIVHWLPRIKQCFMFLVYSVVNVLIVTQLALQGFYCKLLKHFLEHNKVGHRLPLTYLLQTVLSQMPKLIFYYFYNLIIWYMNHALITENGKTIIALLIIKVAIS